VRVTTALSLAAVSDLVSKGACSRPDMALFNSRFSGVAVRGRHAVLEPAVHVRAIPNLTRGKGSTCFAVTAK
jgi:hypothetical protein